jgi:hypothetical protein
LRAPRWRARGGLAPGEEASFRALGALLAVGLVGAAAAVAVSRGGGNEEPTAPVGAAPAGLTPASPSRYDVPRSAVPVSTSAALRRALRHPRPTDIVLADGVYDAPTPFLNANGHRLYAARAGGATLRAGLSLGANGGPGGGSVQGLLFDVRDERKTAQGAEILVWGSARNAAVRDVVLRGNRAVRAGLVVRQPEGFRAERLVALDFTDYGVVVDAHDPARTKLTWPFQLIDVRVAGVARPVPGSSDGRAEACVWIGNPGIVRRVHARDCAWTALWTGTAATQALFDRVDVDDTRTGVYIEHFTHRSIFQRLRVGEDVRVGVLAEWAAPAWDRRPASVGNVIQDSWIGASVAGVYLDEGTARTIVRRTTFANQHWAAIGDYRGIDNTYYGNNYEAIAPGAEEVTEEHLSSFGDENE